MHVYRRVYSYFDLGEELEKLWQTRHFSPFFCTFSQEINGF